MTQSTIIDLLRHGTPVGGRRYRGQVDDPLSEQGWAEMWAAVDGSNPWQQIVCSPLRRCREFAEALGDKLALSVTVDPRLQEVGFGAWEGRSPEELRQQDPELISRFYHDPIGNRPMGAEPLEDFSARVSQAVTDILQRHQGQHTLVVTHAGVIRAALTQVLQAPLGAMYRMSVATASLSRIRSDGERPPTILFQGRTRL